MKVCACLSADFFRGRDVLSGVQANPVEIAERGSHSILRKSWETLWKNGKTVEELLFSAPRTSFQRSVVGH